jgi:hypothetical protein
VGAAVEEVSCAERSAGAKRRAERRSEASRFNGVIPLD